jgi:hypothetical protein
MPDSIVGRLKQITLDIPMQNALLVRRSQPFGDLTGNAQGFVQLERAFLDLVPQARPLDQFHGQEPVLLVQFEHRADVWVVQRRGGLRFAHESSAKLKILNRPKRQELERDRPVELGVLGLVDDAHAALAELVEDAVVRDRMTCHPPSLPYPYFSAHSSSQMSASLAIRLK